MKFTTMHICSKTHWPAQEPEIACPLVHHPGDDGWDPGDDGWDDDDDDGEVSTRTSPCWLRWWGGFWWCRSWWQWQFGWYSHTILPLLNSNVTMRGVKTLNFYPASHLWLHQSAVYVTFPFSLCFINIQKQPRFQKRWVTEAFMPWYMIHWKGRTTSLHSNQLKDMNLSFNICQPVKDKLWLKITCRKNGSECLPQQNLSIQKLMT